MPQYSGTCFFVRGRRIDLLAIWGKVQKSSVEGFPTFAEIVGRFREYLSTGCGLMLAVVSW